MAEHGNAVDELMAMSTEEILQAQLELYHHCVALVKSMALKAATDLRVPDVIYRRGGAATLSDLAADTGIHPTKVAHLRRIMRVLTTSGGVFSIQNSDDGGTPVYKLTRVSRLLVESSRHELSAMVGVLVDPFAVTAFFSIPKWFTDERAASVSLFEVAHGCTRVEMVAKDASYGGMFHAGMTSDSRFILDILLRESSGVFQGVGSLVDIGGGHGAVASAIATAFPQIRCTVLELPDVVAGAPADIGNVEFEVGDMFEYIPPADALLFKWIFHVWQDEDCVKILRQCKKALPPRDAGGKVIIIDTVVGCGSQQVTVSSEMQLWLDVYMMYVDGEERDELEWKKIFLEAGFSDYKITPVLGFRSLIEVYP
ncbi:hypothetical protein QYE76_035007 [Lolium multiflorum]|uniref:Uncharacterized protein n=1 Tax=Lolium multiflorum TaxID=4521 RepID=A0AAD8R0Q9_LOLMU|nr:hypothetical protein QYE76_035007 [Lolium multiflorum]